MAEQQPETNRSLKAREQQQRAAEKEKKEKQEQEKKKKEEEAKKEKPKPKWPWFLAGAVVLGFVALVVWLVFAPKRVVETDDARVVVHYTNVAPRVSGQVASVLVDDNQPVYAGQLLVTLDPRDYLASVANAEATLARDRARVGGASGSLARQPALIGQAQANIPAAQARLALAQDNAVRYRNLAATGAGTVQSRQQAEAALQQAQSDLDSALAALQAAQQQIPILNADRRSAEAQVGIDQASLDQARLNLSYTRITAPMDGMVGQRSVQIGNFVSAGGPLMSVVPLREVYIEADYREVALRNVLPGQHVRIHVDAYNIDLDGTVDSLAPATGATFSAIPPENATGNFTKIVQRLTVKILVSPNQPAARLLRVGLNVETRIDTGLANVVGAQDQRGPAARPVTSR